MQPQECLHSLAVVRIATLDSTTDNVLRETTSAELPGRNKCLHLDKQLYNKKVLVIGDSFTAHGETTENHWLRLLSLHYNWQVHNLSVGGSGSVFAWHSFLTYDKDFDICIFAWSQPGRLYVPGVPYLNSYEVEHKIQYKEYLKPLYDAASAYYKYVFNNDLENIKNKALLHYLDSVIQEDYEDKMFFHFHSFENTGINLLQTSNKNNFYYCFKNGISFYPSLIYLSINDPDAPDDLGQDRRKGHLSEALHTKIANSFINYTVKNVYQNGREITAL